MPDDPGRPDGDDADADPSELEDWIDARDEPDDEPGWDYEAEHPESVIPQLNHDGVLSGLEHPPSPDQLAREEAVRAEVERENQAEREKKAREKADAEEIVVNDEISRITRDLEEMILVDEEAAEEAAEEARTKQLAEEALEEQRRLLESIEAPKRAAAEAEEERRREDAAEKKYQLDLSWRRIAAGIAIFAGLGYGCTQLIGDDGDTASDNEPAAQQDDDTLGAVNAPGDANPVADGQSEDTPTPPQTPAEPQAEVASRPPGVGITETTGFIDSACAGFYEVFLRITAFNNFQVSAEQLSTEGGQGFETTMGWSNDRVALTALTENEFLQLWFFVWTASELFAVYNVFGPVGDFTPPESPDDLARYESVDGAEALATASGVGDGGCADEVQDLTATNTGFPAG